MAKYLNVKLKRNVCLSFMYASNLTNDFFFFFRYTHGLSRHYDLMNLN